MKQLAGYLSQFAREINRKTFFAVTFYTAIFICINQYFALEKTFLRLPSRFWSFTSFFVMYFLVFGGSYLIITFTQRASTLTQRPITDSTIKYRNKDGFFYFLILITTCFFAWRVTSGVVTQFADSAVTPSWQRFAGIVVNSPFKFLLMMILVAIIKAVGDYPRGLTGLKRQQPSLAPFLVMLLLFAPVIFIVAAHPDFLATYPKYKIVENIGPGESGTWVTKTLFEISYAFDFISAEVFFRGLLIFAFARYAGPTAVLPTAAFYCAIHFGKPAAECISSYFGGIILGIIAYRTHSIIGGLVLHLGIGWLMEAGGLLYT